MLTETSFGFAARSFVLSLVFIIFSSAVTFAAGPPQAACEINAPQAISPAGQAQGRRPTFSWSVVANAEDYFVYLIPTADIYVPDGSPWTTMGPFTTTSFTPTEDLPAADYVWLVTARNSQCGFSAFSTPQFFLTDTACPSRTPQGGPPEVDAQRTARFTWSVASGAAMYVVWVVDVSTVQQVFQTLVKAPIAPRATFGWLVWAAETTLPPGTYAWAVHSFNSVCGSSAADPVLFVVP
jgi:hypothetical protein